MRLTVLPVVLLAALGVACASTPAPAPAPVAATPTAAAPDDLSGVARTFVERLLSGDHEAARADFDEKMLEVATVAHLEAVSRMLVEQNGEFRSVRDVAPKELGDYTHVYVDCEFARQPAALRVVFPRGGRRITGFFLVKR